MAATKLQDDSAHNLFELGLTIIPIGSLSIDVRQSVMDECKGNIENAREKWTKTPLVKWRHYQNYDVTEETFENWLNRYAGCNWAIVTGKGINVVDGDSKEAIDFIESNLTRTPWRVKTGKGYHYYYRATNKRIIKNSVGENKIDIRGVGGYVVAPGSIHFSGAIYEWDRIEGIADTPDDLPELTESDLNKILEFNNKNKSAANDSQFEKTENGFRFTPGKLEQELGFEPVAEGQRNNRCAQLAGKLFGQGKSQLETLTTLYEWNETLQNPLSLKEIKITVESIARTHMNRHPGSVIPIRPVDDITPDEPVDQQELKIYTESEAGKPSFPIELLEMGGFIGDTMRLINETAFRKQPIFAFNAAVLLTALLTDRKFMTPTGAGLNQYIISLGETGCGKEHPLDSIQKIATELGLPDSVGGGDMASGQGLFTRVDQSPNILFPIDEFGLFMKAIQAEKLSSHKAMIMNNLMQFYGRSNSIFKGPEYANPMRQRVDIRAPHVYLYATSTGSQFWSALDSEHVVSGYLNRFLVTETPVRRPAVNLDTNEFAIPESIKKWHEQIKEYKGNKGNLHGVAGMSFIKIPFHRNAKNHYFNIVEQCDSEAGKGVYDLWIRGDSMVIKLASVFAVSDDPFSPAVTLRHLDLAHLFFKYSVELSSFYVMQNMSDNQQQAKVKELLKHIRSAGPRGVTKKEFNRDPFTKWAKREREEILKSLIDAKLVSNIVRVTGFSKRPRDAFVALQLEDD